MSKLPSCFPASRLILVLSTETRFRLLPRPAFFFSGTNVLESESEIEKIEAEELDFGMIEGPSNGNRA
jgi:hypothetical protein